MRFRYWHQYILTGILGGIFLMVSCFLTDPLVRDELNPPPKLGIRCIASIIIGFLLGNIWYISNKIDLFNRLTKLKKLKKWNFIIILSIYYGFIGGTFSILVVRFISAIPWSKEPPIFFLFNNYLWIYLWNILGGFLYGYFELKDFQKKKLEEGRSEP